MTAAVAAALLRFFLSVGDPAASPFEALLGPDPVACERARRALLALETDRLAPLAALARRPSGWERERVAWTLYELGDRAPADALAPLLADEDAGVREAALRALGRTGFERDLAGLLGDALAHPWWAVRREAALCVGRTWRGGSPPLGDVVPLLTDQDPDVASAAERVLLLVGGPAAERAVAQSLFAPGVRPPPERVRRFLDRVGRFRDPSLVTRARTLLTSPEEATVLAAAAALARMEEPVLKAAPAQLRRLVVRAACSGDPDLSVPGELVLAREPEAGARALLDEIDRLDPLQAIAAAQMLVRLGGPEAYEPLSALVGDERRPLVARAAAVRALRLFETERTALDLSGSFAPTLPLALRDEILAALERLPWTRPPPALALAIEDAEPRLRVRALGLLLARWTPSDEEVRRLAASIERDRVDWCRARRLRLLARHVRGDAALLFAYRLVERLVRPDPQRFEARQALENLADEDARRKIGSLLARRLPDPLDVADVRLLARLAPLEADGRIAAFLSEAAARGAEERLRAGLRAVRGRAGAETTAVLRTLAQVESESLSAEALRALLRISDRWALERLVQQLDGATPEDRLDWIAFARETPDDRALSLFVARRLERTDDVGERRELLAVVGERRLPLGDLVVADTAPDRPLPVRLAAIESIGAIGDARALERLLPSFLDLTARARRVGLRGLSSDDRLLLQVLARAFAQAGRADAARLLAGLLFADLPRHTASLERTDAAFPPEQALLAALVELSARDELARTVEAALVAELDRLQRTGLWPNCPKALLWRFAEGLRGSPLEGGEAMRRCLDWLCRVPPFGDGREVVALEALADSARRASRAEEEAEHLFALLRLLELGPRVDSRWVRRALGEPAPHVGFLPRLNVRARALTARARALARAGKRDAASLAYRRAAAQAPWDAALLVAVAADEFAFGFYPAAREHAFCAAERAGWDFGLLLEAARVLVETGGEEVTRRLLARLEALDEHGLHRPSVVERFAIAETAVRVGDTERARRQVELALAQDVEEARSRLERDPILAALVGRREENR